MKTKLLESENDEEGGLRRTAQCRLIVGSEYENEQDVYAASQEASI